MKNEDKEFLAQLAHELNTQDNCATKNPVYERLINIIKETKWEEEV